MFFLPGLYSVAELPDADGVLQQRFTYTIITRNANDVMKNIHNGGDNRGRMPLFLPFELSKSWLDEDVTPDEYRDILNFEMPSEELEYWPVFSIRTSKPHPTGGKKNDPYEWAKLPPLGVGNPD
jgi:putative SOS response-associated peptidase YedK